MTVPTYEDFLAEQLTSLRRFSGALVGDRWTAEDILQDVLVKAHRRWPDISRADQPSAYVRRMVVNEFVSWPRKWARIRPSADIADTADPSDPVAQMGDRDALRRQLRALPRKQQAAVVLRYYDDQTYADIGAALGCTEASARTLVSRALATMRVDLTAQNSENSRGGAHAQR